MDEKRLWLAVLIRASQDVCSVSLQTSWRDKERLQRSARAWFESDGDGEGSFYWVCSLFDISPQSFRSRLFQLARMDPRAMCQMMERNRRPQADAEPADELANVRDAHYTQLNI